MVTLEPSGFGDPSAFIRDDLHVLPATFADGSCVPGCDLFHTYFCTCVFVFVIDAPRAFALVEPYVRAVEI